MKDEESDIVFDPEIEEPIDDGYELAVPAKVKKLQERIKELEKEKTEYLDGWQRARADYANLQKSTDEDKKRLKSILEEDWMHKLIPVVDSFQMAFVNREAWEKIDPAWRSGVEYIYQQLMNTLESHGLKLFGEVGETFDPTKYEAVSEEETDDKNLDHTIAKVIQRGFIFGDQVIRPARVVVYTKK